MSHRQTETASSPLVRLIYTSEALIGAKASVEMAVAERAAAGRIEVEGRDMLGFGTALCDILHTSRAHNARAGITGALLFDGKTFDQVLEGPDDEIEALFGRIRRDRRNHRVTALGIEVIGERICPDWNMALIGPSRGTSTAAFARWRTALRRAALRGDGARDLLWGLDRDAHAVRLIEDHEVGLSGAGSSNGRRRA